ncbi:MAG TPA: hypothetical protein VNZ47_11795 [Candidatus Dormibacteraeota bacterium]|nr:hypothetical protein [Candidatus Dormibacteraeota bacterium]
MTRALVADAKGFPSAVAADERAFVVNSASRKKFRVLGVKIAA